MVLCLLDVARIACVKHGFTEAPGLVKFEQEIDRELAAELAAASKQAAKIKLNDANPDMQIHQASLKFAVDDFDSLSSHHDHLISSRKTKNTKQDNKLNDDKSQKSQRDVLQETTRYISIYDDDDLGINNKDTDIIERFSDTCDGMVKVTDDDLDAMGAMDAQSTNDQLMVRQQQDDNSDIDIKHRKFTSDTTASLLNVAYEINVDCDKSSGRSMGSCDETEDDTLLQNSMIMEQDSLNSSRFIDDMGQQPEQDETIRLEHSQISEDRVTLLSRLNHQDYPLTPSCIPTLIKRTNSNCSIASNQTIASSDLSSSQSSTCHQKHRVTSDLDGKVSVQYLIDFYLSSLA